MTSFLVEDPCELNPTLCDNGECVTFADSYICVCDPGFTGDRCDETSEASESSAELGLTTTEIILGFVGGIAGFLIFVVAPIAAFIYGLMNYQRHDADFYLRQMHAGATNQQRSSAGSVGSAASADA